MSRKVAVRKSELWRSIRRHCLACCGDSPSEVAACVSEECDLWAFRLGRIEEPCENEVSRSPRCADFALETTNGPRAGSGTGKDD